MQAGRQLGMQTDILANRQTHRHADRHIGRQTDTLACRQTHWQTDRQIGMQAVYFINPKGEAVLCWFETDMASQLRPVEQWHEKRRAAMLFSRGRE